MSTTDASLAQMLDTPASQWRTLLHSQNLRLSRSGRVHEVVLRPWIGGIQVPVARCGASTPAGPLSGSYAATTDPVDCRACGGESAVLRESTEPMLPLMILH